MREIIDVCLSSDILGTTNINIKIFLVVRREWKADAHPVLKVDDQSQGHYKVKCEKLWDHIFLEVQ